MNCIIIEDDKLSMFLVQEYISKVDNLKLIYSFSDALEALSKLKGVNEDVDLIFLDIEMPEMTGFEFLNVLQKYPQIIIISAQEKYAITSFEYEITDYLLKPITFERFLRAVEKAYTKKDFNVKKSESAVSDNTSFYIKTNQSVIRLKYESILYIEALENYVNICTFENKYTVLHTMRSLEDKLNDKNFKRVHRSYIVNMNKVQKIQHNKIIMPTSEGIQKIPMSKSYKKNIIENLPFIKYL